MDNRSPAFSYCLPSQYRVCNHSGPANINLNIDFYRKVNKVITPIIFDFFPKFKLFYDKLYKTSRGPLINCSEGGTFMHLFSIAFASTIRQVLYPSIKRATLPLRMYSTVSTMSELSSTSTEVINIFAPTVRHRLKEKADIQP